MHACGCKFHFFRTKIDSQRHEINENDPISSFFSRQYLQLTFFLVNNWQNNVRCADPESPPPGGVQEIILFAGERGGGVWDLFFVTFIYVNELTLNFPRGWGGGGVRTLLTLIRAWTKEQYSAEINSTLFKHSQTFFLYTNQKNWTA